MNPFQGFISHLIFSLGNPIIGVLSIDVSSDLAVTTVIWDPGLGAWLIVISEGSEGNETVSFKLTWLETSLKTSHMETLDQ